ncbi:MAG: hypothetical protein ACMUJM_08520 [bacterium]
MSPARMITICSNKIIFILILLFISCAPFSQPTSFETLITSQIESMSSTHKIELFVMSQCPYAIEAEKAIIPVLKKIKDKVDFRLYFIAEEENEDFNTKFLDSSFEKTEDIEEHREDKCHGEFISEGGKFKSLHGKSEIDEAIRQVVIAKYYPEKFFHYLLLRSENYSSNNWEECAVKAWIDCEFISKIAQSNEAEQLFRQNIRRAHELKVNASPTLFINGKRNKEQITQFGVGRIICKEGRAYEFCKTVPVCGTDADCLATGKVGVCINANTPEAACKFNDPVSFKLTVINPSKECPPCSPKQLLVMIKNLFPAVEVTHLDNNSAEAKNLIDELDIKELPAFYFGKNITQTARYQKIKDRLLEIKNGYLLNPEYLTVSYLAERKEMQGDIKLFVQSMSPKAIATENFLIEDGFINKAYVDIHYIAGKVNSKDKKVNFLTVRRDNDNPDVLHLQPKQEKVIFKSPKGMKEIQEDIRQLCINKYYPAYYYDYLSCINKKLEGSEENIDWRQCLGREESDYKKIAFCTNSEEGMNMLLQDIALIEELEIYQCPTYLVNNTILVKDIDPMGFKMIYSELTQEGK